MRSAAGFCPTHAGARGCGAGLQGPGRRHSCKPSRIASPCVLPLPACPICQTAAPEQIIGHRCTLAADLYSFGLLLIQLATQQAVVRHRGDWCMPRAPEECPQVCAVSPALHSPSQQPKLSTQPCRVMPEWSYPCSRP
jgi:hypothetical protein